MTPAGPVPVSAYGGASGAVLLWRRAGQLWLTSIQKVRLRLVANQAATLVHGVEIMSYDAPTDAGASRALEVPTDLAPALPGAEVLLSGHACAPSTAPVSSISVRLIVSRDDACLVDKTLHVYGDRPAPGAAPRPFVRMPIVYDRAVGGPSTDNPVGRALNDRSRPPNIVNPVDPWVVAGFGPIATSWPQRSRLARTPPTFHGHVLDVPEETQLDFFHAAPKDQRAARFFGDEWIVIDGMHPGMPRFQCQLPQVRVRSRVARMGSVASHSDIDMEIARIAIDMDHLVCDVTWRGTASVDAAELGSVQVIGGLDAIAEDDESVGPNSGETMMLSEDQLRSVMQEQALPWAQRSGDAPPAPRRSSPGPALMGLPFAPPPTGVAAFDSPPPPPPPAWAPARSSTTPEGGAELFNEVTITSVDDSVLGGLPFGQSGMRPAFAVPRVGDDPPDDSSAHTAITPATQNPYRTAPLPFSPSSAAGSAPPPPAMVPPPALVAPAPVSKTIVDSADDSQPLETAIDMPAVSFDDPSLAELGIDVKRSASALPFTTAQPASVPPPAIVAPARASVAPLAVLGVSSITSSPETIAQKTPAPPELIETKTRFPDAEPKGETGLRKTVLDNVRAHIAMHGMDLTSADLSGLDLSGAILGGAKLDGAKLAGSVLKGARLGGAKLIGADLRGADLTEADLARADLTRANFVDAVLESADLTGATAALITAERAKLTKVRADRARFVQAHLEDATLDDASLCDVELSGAFVERASFRRAQLSGARLGDAHASGAVFEDAALDGAIFTGASLERARFDRATAPRTTWERVTADGVSFVGANLRDASFARASVPGASFASADLTKADLSNVMADGADFTEAKLVACDMRMAKLAAATLVKASMRDANAAKVILTSARFDGAQMEKVSLRGARMKGCELVEVRLDGADLRDADLEGAKLRGTDVSKAKMAGANLKGVEGLEKTT